MVNMNDISIYLPRTALNKVSSPALQVLGQIMAYIGENNAYYKYFLLLVCILIVYNMLSILYDKVKNGINLIKRIINFVKTKFIPCMKKIFTWIGFLAEAQPDELDLLIMNV